MATNNSSVKYWSLTAEGIVTGTEYHINGDRTFYVPATVVRPQEPPSNGYIESTWKWPPNYKPLAPFDTATPEAIRDDVLAALQLQGISDENVAMLLRHIAFLEKSIRELITD